MIANVLNIKVDRIESEEGPALGGAMLEMCIRDRPCAADRGTAERIAGKEEALSESWNHGRPFFIFDSGLGRV